MVYEKDFLLVASILACDCKAKLNFANPEVTIQKASLLMALPNCHHLLSFPYAPVSIEDR